MGTPGSTISQWNNSKRPYEIDPDVPYPQNFAILRQDMGNYDHMA